MEVEVFYSLEYRLNTRHLVTNYDRLDVTHLFQNLLLNFKYVDIMVRADPSGRNRAV